MNVFLQPTPATKPKTKNVIQISLLLAAMLVLFIMTQVVTLNGFTRLIESFWLPGGVKVAHLVTAVIVITEVLALPFLLRMRMSLAMRVLCMVCGWFVAIIWLGLSIWLIETVNAIHNVGFLGTVIELEPGWWAVWFSVALGILSVWASWGMWPATPKK
jgi:hypothetical protein